MIVLSVKAEEINDESADGKLGKISKNNLNYLKIFFSTIFIFIYEIPRFLKKASVSELESSLSKLLTAT